MVPARRLGPPRGKRTASYGGGVARGEDGPTDDGTSARPPLPPDIPVALLTAPDEDVDDQFPDLDGLELTDVTVAYPDARSLGILRSRISACHLDVPEDATIDAQDAELTDLDLTGRHIEALTRVVLRRCRLGGADLGGGRFRDVTFEDCVLDLASLRTAELEAVVIRGCRAEDLDFSRARLTDVVLRDIALGPVTLGGAHLERVDLTGADLTGATDMSSLRGAIISDGQAMSLARRLAASAGLHVAGPIG